MLVRTVKGLGGDVSQIIAGPIQDASRELVTAVNLALTVISWHENLPEDEQPPRHLWWSEELLDEWFQGVKERRKEKTGGSGTQRRSPYQEASDVPMMENELIAQYRPDAQS